MPAAADSIDGRTTRTPPSWMIYGLLAAAPLAIGTVHLWTRTVLFACTSLVLAATIWIRWRSEGRIPITVPLLALAVAFLATAAQLVPLPAALLERLSPRAHEIFSMAYGDYGVHPITLDVGGTLAELAKLGAYLAFFVTVCSFASRTHRRRNLLVAIVAVADLVSIIGVLQTAIGSHGVLFFYEPNGVHASGLMVRGTFVNANNFGGLLCLAAPCALVLGLRTPRWRWFAYGSLVLLNLCVVLSLSRSTIVAAPLAQGLAWFFERRAQKQRPAAQAARGELRIVAALAVVGTLAIGATVAVDQLLPELRNTEKNELGSPMGDKSKVHFWRTGAELAMEYPWVGHGRGAFEQAFSQFNEHSGVYRFNYLENGYVQAPGDWGFPVALLLAVLAGWAVYLAVGRLTSEPLAAGALAGLLGLAVHEMVDFAVDLPGVAFPALAALAVIFGRSASEPARASRRVAARPWFLVAPLVTAATVVLALVVPTAAADAKRLDTLASDPAVSPARLEAEGEAVFARHPADYFVPAIMARRFAQDRKADALLWLNRSMFLNPRYAPPHLMAAELLVAAGRQQQALLEYRLAVFGVVDPAEVWERVYSHYKDVDSLLAACPEEGDYPLLLGHFLAARKDPAGAKKVYEKVLQADAENLPARQQLVRIAIDAKDTKGALAGAEALFERDGSVDTRLLVARANIEAGHLERAALLLDGAVAHTRQQLTLELSLVEALAKAGQLDRARARLDGLTWDQGRTQQIYVHQARAEIERRAGNEHQYLWELQQAAKLKER